MTRAWCRQHRKSTRTQPPNDNQGIGKQATNKRPRSRNKPRLHQQRKRLPPLAFVFASTSMQRSSLAYPCACAATMTSPPWPRTTQPPSLPQAGDAIYSCRSLHPKRVRNLAMATSVIGRQIRILLSMSARNRGTEPPRCQTGRLRIRSTAGLVVCTGNGKVRLYVMERL